MVYRSPMIRNLPLSGIQNARQIGGIVIVDKVVRCDVLLRTANLSTASDEDLALLRDTYHVAQVFDFRSTYEHEVLPDQVIEHCTYYWLPCLDQAVKGMGQDMSADASKPQPSISKIGEAILHSLDAPQVKQMADNLYPMIVFDEGAQRQYATFLAKVAELPEGHAALWHCTQGKDRAGCASAFLLAALGASREQIVEDFSHSNAAYQPLIDRLEARARENGADDEKVNLLYALIGVSVPNFERTLDAINVRYGSLDNYLTDALGCDCLLRDQLKKRFLQ